VAVVSVAAEMAREAEAGVVVWRGWVEEEGEGGKGACCDMARRVSIRRIDSTLAGWLSLDRLVLQLA
jgi:hypothetical protein